MLRAALGKDEPEDRRTALALTMRPSPVKTDGGRVRHPINFKAHDDRGAVAWALLHGIETGWFSYDGGGFLEWSARGLSAYPGACVAPGYLI